MADDKARVALVREIANYFSSKSKGIAETELTDAFLDHGILDSGKRIKSIAAILTDSIAIIMEKVQFLHDYCNNNELSALGIYVNNRVDDTLSESVLPGAPKFPMSNDNLIPLRRTVDRDKLITYLETLAPTDQQKICIRIEGLSAYVPGNASSTDIAHHIYRSVIASAGVGIDELVRVVTGLFPKADIYVPEITSEEVVEQQAYGENASKLDVVDRKEHEALLAERDAQAAEIVKLKEVMAAQSEKVETLKKDREDSEVRINNALANAYADRNSLMQLTKYISSIVNCFNDTSGSAQYLDNARNLITGSLEHDKHLCTNLNFICDALSQLIAGYESWESTLEDNTRMREAMNKASLIFAEFNSPDTPK